jgi:tetratricopeptide (TPR) repeat protein
MIRYRLRYLFILILFTGELYASVDTALVRFSDLKFNSSFENEAFTAFRDGHADYLKLFLAASPESGPELYERDKKEIFIEEGRITGRGFSRLKERSKVEKVYTKVNEDILKQYEEQVLFPEVFLTGKFNCLTASAYYGLIFSDLGIEFGFRESANHVHPVAYPSSLQIKVESTDPVFGFQYFDDRLKSQFISYLISSRIITKEDARKYGTEEIFRKYYFPESSIGMKELAGLQYLNVAFYKYGKENYPDAFRQIQKAWYLYPSERISTVMLFLLSRCLTAADYTSLKDAEYLAFASRFSGKGLDATALVNEFRHITDIVLIERSQPDLYDDIFRYLDDNIEDSAVIKSISSEYYYRKGRMYLNNSRIGNALEMFSEALALEPGNAEYQSFAVKSLAYSFESVPNQEMVNSAEAFELKFPLTAANESFISLKMLAYLRNGEEKFDFDKPAEGITMIEKFEKLFREHPGISIQYDKAADAYSAAAVYYFKRNEKAKAKEYLKRGLAVAPDNYELRYRLKSLE